MLAVLLFYYWNSILISNFYNNEYICFISILSRSYRNYNLKNIQRNDNKFFTISIIWIILCNYLLLYLILGVENKIYKSWINRNDRKLTNSKYKKWSANYENLETLKQNRAVFPKEILNLL